MEKLNYYLLYTINKKAGREYERKILFIFFIGLALLFIKNLESLDNVRQERTIKDLIIWKAVLEMIYADYGEYPKVADIKELGALVKKSNYWNEPIIYDRWNNLFKYKSIGDAYKIISIGEDGKEGTDDDIAITIENKIFSSAKKETKEKESLEFRIKIPILNPGTSLAVSKSGNDVVLSWTGTGSSYDGVGAIDKTFYNNYLLFKSLASFSYTYTNALINTKDIEYFDVTDETEDNRGKDANGELPPPPPEITTLTGSIYIGGSVTINGNNFSNVPGDNNICFGGGICVFADTATETSLSFTVPASAVSGSLSVSIGELQSEDSDVQVMLEDPANAWTTRTIGFSKFTGDYWAGGSYSGNNGFLRIYYDTNMKKWLKEDRSGSYLGNILYCSTKTDRMGRVYCGLATVATGGGGTRYAQTNPPSNLQNCINLGGSGNSTNVRGAAADPNPEAIAGRDVVYFAHANADTSSYLIKKVSSDCLTIIDSNYGNTNWYPNWNSIVGMAVDAANGDLYVAEPTQIKVIHLDESIEVFKTGFSNIYGIDVWREPGSNFGYLIVADNGASQIKGIALDNPTAVPIILSSASIARAVSIAWTTYSTWDYKVEDIIRLIVVHNSGNTVPVIKDEPFLISEPYKEDVKIWISSPVATDLAEYQGRLRASDLASPVYSTMKIKAYWKEGKGSRTICAILGDVRSRAAYEPAPNPIPAGCSHPWKNPWTGEVYGICDNHENFAVGGVGSPIEGGDFVSCKQNCGESRAKACEFEFQITRWYSGDNYRLYYWIPQNPWTIKSAIITAWKRIFIEQDKMCRRGGIIKDDANAGSQIIYLAMNDDGSQADNVNQGDIIHIFDSLNTLESDHDIACVKNKIIDLANKRMITELGSEQNCNQAYSLQRTYEADKDGIGADPWDFSSGRSAGVCVEGSGFYEADSSRLNKRDKTGAIDDAFVSFKSSNNGANVVPYLPIAFFDGAVIENRYRFQQIWFKNRNKQPPNFDNDESNYWHLIGASEKTNTLGISRYQANAAFIFVGRIENPAYCSFIGPPARECTATEKTYNKRDTTSHEMVHLFGYDADEIAVDWAWCGDPNDPTTFQCDHPDGDPPNNNYNGQYCIMSPRMAGDQDRALAMRTDNVHRLDCFLLYGQVCHNEPAGRPSIRLQTDPQ